MKKVYVLLTAILFSSTFLFSQKIDSITLPNAVLYYSIQGEGPPILLLSGGPGISSDQLSGISERLSKNYQCILFDQRGTGKSHTSPMDSTTINLYQAIQDINSLLEKQNIKKITIIGHSWGAMLATSYAIKYPSHVAKLILIGPGPLDMSDYNFLEDNIICRASKAEKIFMQEVNDSIANHTASQELLKAYSKTFIRFFLYDASRADSLSEKIKGKLNNTTQQLMFSDLGRSNYNVKPGVAKLKMPILTICGRQDPVGVFQTLTIQRINTRAKIAWIEKSGHFPWIEKPESFYLALTDFFK